MTTDILAAGTALTLRIIAQSRGRASKKLLNAAADEIEALVARAEKAEQEVEALRGEVERWRNNSDNGDMHIADLQAEVARLETAMEAIEQGDKTKHWKEFKTKYWKEWSDDKE